MPMNDDAPETSKYRWVVMSVWFTATVMGFMVASTVGILLPSISEELNLSPSQQGMLGSSAFWGNLILAIPLSWWTSRYGPKLLTTVTVNEFIPAGCYQPRDWVVGSARSGPHLKCAGNRFLYSILSRIYISDKANEGCQRARIRRLQCCSGLIHRRLTHWLTFGVSDGTNLNAPRRNIRNHFRIFNGFVQILAL